MRDVTLPGRASPRCATARACGSRGSRGCCRMASHSSRTCRRRPARCSRRCRCVGRVLETNYGLTFDVRSVPQPENLAYSDLGLGLHTDNPYREPVPGFQALHALIPSNEGGDSLFADGFALAAHLRATAPEAFALLTTTAVPFLYRSGDAELYAERPLIQLSTRGDIAAVHYNSRSIAPLHLTRSRGADASMRAYRRFAALLREARFQLRTRLGARHRWWCSTISAFCTAAPPSHRPGTRAICAAATSRATASTARRRCCGAGSPTAGTAHERGARRVLAIYGARGSGAYFGEQRVDDRARPAGGVLRAGADGARADAHRGRAAARRRASARGGPGGDRGLDRAMPATRRVGARWLAQRFAPRVSEPVRLHVPAKRYLCATDADYFGQPECRLGAHAEAAGRRRCRRPRSRASKKSPTTVRPCACVAGTIRARSRDSKPRASPITRH